MPLKDLNQAQLDELWTKVRNEPNPRMPDLPKRMDTALPKFTSPDDQRDYLRALYRESAAYVIKTRDRGGLDYFNKIKGHATRYNTGYVPPPTGEVETEVTIDAPRQTAGGVERGPRDITVNKLSPRQQRQIATDTAISGAAAMEAGTAERTPVREEAVRRLGELGKEPEERGLGEKALNLGVAGVDAAMEQSPMGMFAHTPTARANLLLKMIGMYPPSVPNIPEGAIEQQIAESEVDSPGLTAGVKTGAGIMGGAAGFGAVGKGVNTAVQAATKIPFVGKGVATTATAVNKAAQWGEEARKAAKSMGRVRGLFNIKGNVGAAVEAGAHVTKAVPTIGTIGAADTAGRMAQGESFLEAVKPNWTTLYAADQLNQDQVLPFDVPEVSLPGAAAFPLAGHLARFAPANRLIGGPLRKVGQAYNLDPKFFGERTPKQPAPTPEGGTTPVEGEAPRAAEAPVTPISLSKMLDTLTKSKNIVIEGEGAFSDVLAGKVDLTEVFNHPSEKGGSIKLDFGGADLDGLKTTVDQLRERIKSGKASDHDKLTNAYLSAYLGAVEGMGPTQREQIGSADTKWANSPNAIIGYRTLRKFATETNSDGSPTKNALFATLSLEAARYAKAVHTRSQETKKTKGTKGATATGRAHPSERFENWNNPTKIGDDIKKIAAGMEKMTKDLGNRAYREKKEDFDALTARQEELLKKGGKGGGTPPVAPGAPPAPEAPPGPPGGVERRAGGRAAGGDFEAMLAEAEAAPDLQTMQERYMAARRPFWDYVETLAGEPIPGEDSASRLKRAADLMTGNERLLGVSQRLQTLEKRIQEIRDTGVMPQQVTEAPQARVPGTEAPSPRKLAAISPEELQQEIRAREREAKLTKGAKAKSTVRGQAVTSDRARRMHEIVPEGPSAKGPGWEDLTDLTEDPKQWAAKVVQPNRRPYLRSIRAWLQQFKRDITGLDEEGSPTRAGKYEQGAFGRDITDVPIDVRGFRAPGPPGGPRRPHTFGELRGILGSLPGRPRTRRLVTRALDDYVVTNFGADATVRKSGNRFVVERKGTAEHLPIIKERIALLNDELFRDAFEDAPDVTTIDVQPFLTKDRSAVDLDDMRFSLVGSQIALKDGTLKQVDALPQAHPEKGLFIDGDWVDVNDIQSIDVKRPDLHPTGKGWQLKRSNIQLIIGQLLGPEGTTKSKLDEGRLGNLRTQLQSLSDPQLSSMRASLAVLANETSPGRKKPGELRRITASPTRPRGTDVTPAIDQTIHTIDDILTKRAAGEEVQSDVRLESAQKGLQAREERSAARHLAAGVEEATPTRPSKGQEELIETKLREWKAKNPGKEVPIEVWERIMGEVPAEHVDPRGRIAGTLGGTDLTPEQLRKEALTARSQQRSGWVEQKYATGVAQAALENPAVIGDNNPNLTRLLAIISQGNKQGWSESLGAEADSVSKALTVKLARAGVEIESFSEMGTADVDALVGGVREVAPEAWERAATELARSPSTRPDVDPSTPYNVRSVVARAEQWLAKMRDKTTGPKFEASLRDSRALADVARTLDAANVNLDFIREQGPSPRLRSTITLGKKGTAGVTRGGVAFNELPGAIKSKLNNIRRMASTIKRLREQMADVEAQYRGAAKEFVRGAPGRAIHASKHTKRVVDTLFKESGAMRRAGETVAAAGKKYEAQELQMRRGERLSKVEQRAKEKLSKRSTDIQRRINTVTQALAKARDDAQTHELVRIRAAERDAALIFSKMGEAYGLHAIDPKTGRARNRGMATIMARHPEVMSRESLAQLKVAKPTPEVPKPVLELDPNDPYLIPHELVEFTGSIGMPDTPGGSIGQWRSGEFVAEAPNKPGDYILHYKDGTGERLDLNQLNAKVRKEGKEFWSNVDKVYTNSRTMFDANGEFIAKGVMDNAKFSSRIREESRREKIDSLLDEGYTVEELEGKSSRELSQMVDETLGEDID